MLGHLEIETESNETMPVLRRIANLLLSVFKRHSKKPSLFKNMTLPSYGKSYLDHLIGEFKSLKPVCGDAEPTKLAMKLADDLVAEAEDGKPMTWGDTYALDEAIAQMLPKTYLHQRAWCLEARYRDAAGNADAYDLFMKLEKDQLSDETEEHLRARVHNMIRELYRLYTVINCRESLRENLSVKARWILIAIFAFIALLWYFAQATPFHGLVELWGLVFAVGATGGLVSLQRRLQSLPSRGESLSDLVELSSGITIKLTPVIGGIFAIVLSLIFCSGLATAPFLPTFSANSDTADFLAFAAKIRPLTTADWGKLLVWSFIAGFAERFVPDTLDRLTTKSEQTKARST